MPAGGVGSLDPTSPMRRRGGGGEIIRQLGPCRDGNAPTRGTYDAGAQADTPPPGLRRTAHRLRGGRQSPPGGWGEGTLGRALRGPLCWPQVPDGWRQEQPPRGFPKAPDARLRAETSRHTERQVVCCSPDSQAWLRRPLAVSGGFRGPEVAHASWVPGMYLTAPRPMTAPRPPHPKNTQRCISTRYHRLYCSCFPRVGSPHPPPHTLPAFGRQAHVTHARVCASPASGPTATQVCRHRTNTQKR